MPRKPKPILTWVVDTREKPETRYRFGHPHRKDLDDGGTLEYKLDEGD